jgi:ATP-dependent exoDNAse (exonuclease V) alpha subunit
VGLIVTDDVEDARARVRPMLGYVTSLASYRRALELDGITDVADVAVIGDEEAVTAVLDGFFAAGATEVIANLLGNEEERRRSLALLGRLAAGNWG